MNLLRLLKKHLGPTLVVLALLVVQAWCELALPSYMSNIVNVGIQQSGIDSPVAPSLRATTALGLSAAMHEQDRSLFEQAYSDPDADGIRHYQGSQENANKDSELAQSMQEAEVSLIDRMVPSVASQQSDTMNEQKALAFVKEELSAQGVDLHAIQQQYLVRTAQAMFVYAGLSLVAAIVAGLMASRIAAAIGRDLRHEVFSRVMQFSQAEVTTFSQASLITRCTNDVQQVQTTMVLLLRMVFLAPIIGAVALFRIVTTDTGLTWIIGAALLAVLGVVVVLLLLTMPRFKRMQKLIDRVNLVTREMLDGIMPIRAFGRQSFELTRFDEASTNLMRTQLFTNRAMMLMMPIMMLVMNGTSVAIVWFGAHGVANGVLQVGDMMAFISYAMMIIMSFLILSMVAVVVPRASVSAERINEVLTTTTSITSPATPHTAPEDVAPGTLCFEKVSFAYPGADEPVVADVSFEAQPGQMVAIVGSTGSGKSSLVQLVPRLFDPTQGRIMLDGQDLRDYDLDVLRRKIGYVPQQGFLFSGTIASNLRFGAPNAEEQDLAQALEVAQAASFVAEREGGINFEIAQGGTNVSGGQRQRLAIARALAIKPEVLVLDDSFSALDYATDKALRHALAAMPEAPTLLVVAQRIASVMAADHIIVLDDGQVVGQGTHKELLANCPTYLEIATSQLSASELGLEEGE